MKLLGRVLLVSALLSTVTAFISSGGADAATNKVTAAQVACRLNVKGLFETKVVLSQVGVTQIGRAYV